MLRVIIFCFIGSGFLGFSFQPDVEYKHKSIQKEIKKIWRIEEYNLKLLVIPKSMNPLETISGKFFEVFDQNNVSQNKFIYIGRVNSCRTGGCSPSDDAIKDYTSEYFDYFILFDQQAAVVSVKVFNYQATHGQEISANGWLKQFNGFNGTKPLRVGKEIDAIAGATISVYGITEDLAKETLLLNKVLVRKN
ncbi:MAG: FMN-binding protein [Bacteroidales bacterium]|nr:FMN-binding protein [Bacteroidales bacterium]MCF8403142.1 FMN-binding protein [Bacteroidales bacterium]